MKFRTLISYIALASIAIAQTNIPLGIDRTTKRINESSVKIPSGFTLEVESGGILLGSGGSLTALNATQLTTGTVPSARLSGTYSSITGLGTISSGTWNGTAIGAGFGGTGLAAYAAGDILYANGSSSLTRLPASTGVLNGGNPPSWGPVNLASGTFVTGTLGLSNGGTNASTAAGARVSLGFVGFYKSASENRDSGSFGSTTPAADTSLSLAVTAGQRWKFQYKVFVNAASATPDITIGINGTAGITSLKWTMRCWQNATIVGGNGPLSGYNVSATYALPGAGDFSFEIEGTLEASSSGNVGIYWSPAVSTTDDLTVTVGTGGEARQL